MCVCRVDHEKLPRQLGLCTSWRRRDAIVVEKITTKVRENSEDRDGGARIATGVRKDPKDRAAEVQRLSERSEEAQSINST